MSDALNQTADAEPKHKRWWSRWLTIFCWVFFSSFLFGFKTFLLQNIPMLILMVAVLGGAWLIAKLIERRFGKMDKRRSFKNLGRFGLFYCGLLLYFCVISLFMRYFVPPVAISPETTHVTGPRNDEGFIDIIGAIGECFASKRRPDENGFRFLLEHFGIDGVFYDASPEKRKTYGDILNQKLAIPENNMPDAAYQSPVRFFTEKFNTEKNTTEHANDAVEAEQRVLTPLEKAYKKVNALIEKSWDETAMREMKEWFEANDKALYLFGEAVRFPDYDSPIVRENKRTLLCELLFYDERFVRDMVEGLQCRIMCSLTGGDAAQAIRDASTIARLADARMRHASSQLHFMLAAGFQEKAAKAMIDTMRYGKLSPEQRTQLRGEWRQHNYIMPVSDLVFLARMESMQTLAEMLSYRFRANADSPPPTAAKVQSFLLVPLLKITVWTPVFKDFQKQFDVLDEIALLPPGRTQIKAFVTRKSCEEINSDFKELLRQIFWKGLGGGMFQIISKINLALAYDSFLSSVDRYYQALARSRMLEIAFALEAYKHDHGEYPESLDALTGEYLVTVPTDPYTDGQPFRYSREPQSDAQSPQEPGAGYQLDSIGNSDKNDDDDISVYWHGHKS
ncbi:MAG: type II secretion system protein GspG [Planctomycetaceae bacterium]|nr:type II secretion system protein GspG [Planctomycetaceae bacterium]